MDAVLGSVLTARGGAWLTRVAGGVIVFWCLGLIALRDTPRHVVAPPACLKDQSPLWCAIGDPAGLVVAAALILTLLVAVGSSALVAATTPAVLLLIAGYGRPWSTGPGRRWAGRRVSAHRRRRTRLVQALQSGDAGAADRLWWYPTGEALLPTRAGNAFAALAQRVAVRHGFDVNACWPVLEQSLSSEGRTSLDTLSGRLSTRVGNLIWCLLALAWAPFLSPRPAVALVIGAGAAAILLWFAVGFAVEQYCALIEALVLTQRHLMYRALGWPAPGTVAQEAECGRALNAYLTRWGNAADAQRARSTTLAWPNADA